MRLARSTYRDVENFYLAGDPCFKVHEYLPDEEESRIKPKKSLFCTIKAQRVNDKFEETTYAW
jgi:hypothetical protein